MFVSSNFQYPLTVILTWLTSFVDPSDTEGTSLNEVLGVLPGIMRLGTLNAGHLKSSDYIEMIFFDMKATRAVRNILKLEILTLLSMSSSTTCKQKCWKHSDPPGTHNSISVISKGLQGRSQKHR